ncbi:Vegetative incompatibility protein HET-E-1 [Lasiodiplodia theobromae]|uniref:Vegetative incompatibility protein HET-E-1 n=1 Tax=Lasiodiplodia theobromae TaxID=45133 RepID=A0A5N5D6T1_9PEZI|nr:Vegetative incompatibility protein HET-E-1 [Lasiodiplodia theobromae]
MAGQSNNFDGTSVSGGFNLQGNQFNGNVNIGGSFRDDTYGRQYLRLLKIVNPKDEMKRILAVKDELLKASYSWILEDETFRSWRNGDTNHLLWIKGGPGKGKTMIMAGLVDILSEEARNSEGAVALSYFFCQNSESELRNVTSIVKGLIYMLAFQETSLVDHLKKKYEAGGEEVFTGPKALFTLWNVLEDMLRDLHGATVYLLVDGLDECDDPEFDNFLRLLSQCNVTTPGKVKWLVTSRPLQRIEDVIRPDQNRSRITLEIEAQHVSQGVEAFIGEKVNLLKLKKKWTEETTQIVHSYLQKNAEGTFLWVVLVCQRLQRFPSWKVQDELTKLTSLQRGLDSFYERMMQVVRDEIPESDIS